MSLDELAEQQRRAQAWNENARAIWQSLSIATADHLEQVIGSPAGLRLEWQKKKAEDRGARHVNDSGYYWGDISEATCFAVQVIGIPVRVECRVMGFWLEGRVLNNLTLKAGREPDVVTIPVSKPTLPIHMYLTDFRDRARDESAFYLWTGANDAAKLERSILALLAGKVPQSDFDPRQSSKSRAAAGCISTLLLIASCLAVVLLFHIQGNF